MSLPESIPATAQGLIYPSDPSAQFPEQAIQQYSAASGKVGVCFSGGGSRAMSAALGQMRGLRQSFLGDIIGAISCVSGGGWFGTLYSFAPSSYSLDTLLGPVQQPEDLTVDGLQSISSSCIGYPITQMYNSGVTAALTILLGEAYWKWIPYNRVWSRMLNIFMLTPFGIGDTSKFFTLNANSLNQILQNNPQLQPQDFYLMRPDTPFFISGATQNYPIGNLQTQVMRHFEYTAQYSGNPQQYHGIGPNGQDFGWGYTDNFIFDTLNPFQKSGNAVTVSVNDPLFTLSDQMGSSSSAPGSEFDLLTQTPDWFPAFNYWPIDAPTQQSSTLYSFTDGGWLENIGIVPLLRRQYRIIVACVNSPYPIGTADGYFVVDGIDAQITRLFGVYPPPDPGLPVTPPTQVFSNQNGEYDRLVNGLKTAKANGGAVIFSDTYQIAPGNYFGIPGYPNNGKVSVIWIYNDMNNKWLSKLPNTSSNNVSALLQSTDRTNYMANFPNYATVGQNATLVDGYWVPEVLPLTVQQVNLLANMHCYNILGDNGEGEVLTLAKCILGE